MRIYYISYIINLIIQAFLFAKVIDIKELKSYDLEDKNRELTNKEARKARFKLLRPFN